MPSKEGHFVSYRSGPFWWYGLPFLSFLAVTTSFMTNEPNALQDEPDLSQSQFDLLLTEAIEKGLICFDLTTKTFSRGPNFHKCPEQDAQPS
jgi:hypothetical protein